MMVIRAVWETTEPTLVATLHYFLIGLIVPAEYLPEHVYQVSLLDCEVPHQPLEALWLRIGQDEQGIDARFDVILLDVLDQALQALLLLLLAGLQLLVIGSDDLLQPWGHFVSSALHVLRDHVPVAKVLDVFLQDEALEALEREAELLVEGEALEGLEVLVHRTLHQFVHFTLEDLFGLQEELPVAQHQDGDVLSWEGRLIEEDLERWVREPTLDLLPQCEVIEFQADWE